MPAAPEFYHRDPTCHNHCPRLPRSRHVEQSEAIFHRLRSSMQNRSTMRFCGCALAMVVAMPMAASPGRRPLLRCGARSNRRVCSRRDGHNQNQRTGQERTVTRPQGLYVVSNLKPSLHHPRDVRRFQPLSTDMTLASGGAVLTGLSWRLRVRAGRRHRWLHRRASARTSASARGGSCPSTGGDVAIAAAGAGLTRTPRHR
jgi:hypothetical protein